jgi:hypothetical protein
VNNYKNNALNYLKALINMRASTISWSFFYTVLQTEELNNINGITEMTI